jgi:hypothetical protein
MKSGNTKKLPTPTGRAFENALPVGVGAKKGNTALAIHNEGFHKAKALLHHHRYDLPPEGAL